jgi:transcriptional regulator with XRE-family HTH domain
MMKDALAEPDVRSSTLTDIATLAGVSRATVSRVVNGSGTVSRKTKLKVLSAISGLRYRPNAHAAELGRENRGIPRHRAADAAASCAPSANITSDTAGGGFNKRRMERQLRLLEEENSRLRRLVDELTRMLETPERIAR